MATQTELTPRAQQILRTLGLPFASLEPAESYSSAVWLTRDYVLQLPHKRATRPPRARGPCCSAIAPGAPYPEVIAVGRDGEYDWLVTRRVPGIVLSAAWPWLHVLSGATRSIQAAAALRAVHGSPAQDLVSPCLLCGAPVMSRQALRRTVAVAWASPAYAPLLAAADTPAATAPATSTSPDPLAQGPRNGAARSRDVACRGAGLGSGAFPNRLSRSAPDGAG